MISFMRVVPAHPMTAEGFFEGLELVRVNDKKLVLVELHFHRLLEADYGNAGAAVVGQQVFKLAEMAFQYRPVDVFSKKIGVFGRPLIVTCLQDHVHDFFQRLQQRKENIE